MQQIMNAEQPFESLVNLKDVKLFCLIAVALYRLRVLLI